MIEMIRMGLLSCLLCMSCGQVKSEEIWSQLRIAVDAHADFTPEQAWHQTQLPAALQLQHAHQIVGTANSPPYWAAWTLTSKDFKDSTLLLSLQSPTQDHSALWVRHGHGVWQLQREMNAQAQRVGEGYLFPTWVLQKPHTETMDVLLRTAGSNRVQFPLVMDTFNVYILKQQRIVLFMGAVLAVPLVVMFYAVALIRTLQNPRLPLFLGMAFCDLIAAMWVSGLLTLLWPALSRIHASWLGSSAYWMLFVLSIFHAQSFLNTAHSNPKTHHRLQKIAWLWLCVVPLCTWLWPEWLRALLLWGGSLHTLVMLYEAWIYWRQEKNDVNASFLGVWLIYASTVVVYWLYRCFEWPLFTTLGVQFVQGAAVATLLGLSASLQVFRERQQLQQSVLISKEKERWYAAVHHDLWQPLQSVQLYAQALLKAPAQQRQDLTNGLQLASQSVDDFMNHLRFSAQGDVTVIEAVPIPVDIQGLLTALITEFMPLAQMRHVVLRYRPCHATVLIEASAVQRMVRNLLSNALHYTPAGGRVLLTCQKRGAVLWLLCIDNGMGMNKAQIDACFEAFTRFDQSHRHINKLGLGLFSFKQLAVQHEMPTRLQSVQGKGTLVGFGMPLIDKTKTT